jgi:hypothetical protein
MIELLLRSSFGNINNRNFDGYKPPEKIETHLPKVTDLLSKYDPLYKKGTQFDYLFEVKLSRFNVLTSQLEALDLKYSLFRHSSEPEDLLIVLVEIPDKKLSAVAEENGIIVDMHSYENTFLQYKCASKTMFARFPARQKLALIKKLFEKEFNISTLEKSKVITKHFLLHTSQRESIEPSWKQHRVKLMLLLPFGKFVPHMEPLNIIKNYYGEKYAIYFTFLAHHVGMLCLVAPVALGI